MWRERDNYYDGEDWWNTDPGTFGPGVNAPSPAPAARKTYSWWSDPDNAPPDWMLDQGRYPSDQQLGAGYYWDWMDDHWGQRPAPGTAGVKEVAPGPATGGGGGGGDYYGGGGGGLGTVGSMISAAPGFSSPRYRSPGGFSWNKPKPFQAPDKDAVFADPGFQARLELGEKAITNAASAVGQSRTGATWKGLIDYGQRMGSQEYGNVYNRRASEYDREYRNAFEDAVTTYGFLADDRQREFQNELAASSAEYAPSLETWRAQNDRDTFGLGLVADILKTLTTLGVPEYK